MTIGLSREAARERNESALDRNAPPGRPGEWCNSRKRPARRVVRAGLFAILTLVCLGPTRSFAGEKAIDRVDVSGDQSAPAIIVRFNVPVTYLSHAPLSEGSTIQVEIRPLRDAGERSVDLAAKERIGFTERAGVPLTDASYEELTPTLARLTLTFGQTVKFRVSQGSDSRSIEISLGGGVAAPKPQQDVVMEAPPPNPTLDEAVPATSLPPGEIAALMEEARAAMEAGDHEKAIRLLTKVLASTGSEEARPEALEMLGLARERNKQIAHAKAEYEEYLRLFPTGEGADRVRQRLAGLMTAASKPRAKLREPSRAMAGADNESELFFRGSLSQALRRDQDMFTDEPEGGVTRFDLDTDLDTTVSYADSDVVVMLRGNGGYVHDLMEAGENSQGRISSLFVEIADPSRAVYGRVGRQSRSTDGVLGRFDGGLLSAQLLDEVRVNLVAGMPVDSSTDLRINSNRYFGGAGVDFGPIFDDWRASLYAIDQTTDGVSDRRAVGGELRYTRSDVTMFGLLDYDVSFDEVNIALFSGNYFFEDRSTFNFAVDYRTSPVLTTTSALQGQPVTTIEDLLTSFDEDQVRQLALDRTVTLKSVSIGASHPFDDNFQVSVDAMVTDTSGTPTSGGVDGMPAIGTEYFYGAQFTGTNLFVDGDIAALGLRYSDQDQFNRITGDLNTRFPVTENLRLNPRLRGDYRWNDAADGTEILLRPSLRTNYRAFEDWELEVEFGGEWRKSEASGVEDDLMGYFAYVTYRIDF